MFENGVIESLPGVCAFARFPIRALNVAAAATKVPDRRHSQKPRPRKSIIGSNLELRSNPSRPCERRMRSQVLEEAGERARLVIDPAPLDQRAPG